MADDFESSSGHFGSLTVGDESSAARDESMASGYRSISARDRGAAALSRSMRSGYRFENVGSGSLAVHRRCVARSYASIASGDECRKRGYVFRSCSSSAGPPVEP